MQLFKIKYIYLSNILNYNNKVRNQIVTLIIFTMTPNMNIQVIEKEQIQFLKFPKEDVLNKRKDQIDRILKLQRALSLGNLEHQKVKIVFMDSTSIKRVETTIWGITDKEVILKQATIIPLERILSIA